MLESLPLCNSLLCDAFPHQKFLVWDVKRTRNEHPSFLTHRLVFEQRI